MNMMDYPTKPYPLKTRWWVFIPLPLAVWSLWFAFTTIAVPFWGAMTIAMLGLIVVLQGAYGLWRAGKMLEYYPHEVAHGKFSYLVPDSLRPLVMKVCPAMFTEGERMVDHSMQWEQVANKITSRIPGRKKPALVEEETSYLSAKDYWSDDDDERL